MPLSEPDPPSELVWLPCVAAWTVTVPPLERLPLPLLSLWWLVLVVTTGAAVGLACFGT